MIRSFTERFAPREWRGARAAAFGAPPDAFQQLVADALRDGLRAQPQGTSVRAAPTAGRDGAIDLFIDGRAALPQPFGQLDGPTIVECKHSDDSLGRVRENVDAAWSKVEKRLAEKARQGWPTPYDPWARARGYVYVISAVLPNQSARDELAARVAACFERLRAAGLTGIDQVRVVDWSDLRPFLDRLPRLADDWLGVGLDALVGHADHLASLALDFRRYLLPEHLPFVAPEASQAAHPDRLLEQATLLAGEGRGLLLTGAGGAGKTRTLVEVAQRASAAGWRVLHALHGEPALAAEDLAGAVLGGSGDTLVTCDYFDQMGLDAGMLRRRLLPQARARGIRFALVASARTARAAADAEGQSFFQLVELAPGEAQAGRILAEMRAAAAPRATALLGEKRVDELCGRRPIIALFILRELERRAAAGRLGDGDLAGIRPSDLLGWLRRRLEEDRLLVRPPASPFDSDEPELTLVAASAALAAAPDLEVAIWSAAEAVAQGRGAAVLSGLRELGWLEGRGAVLAAAHDVVADEVLSQVLRSWPPGTLRPGVLGKVLSFGRRSPRTLGRFAVALRRLHSSPEQAGGFQQALHSEAHAWFAGAATELGGAMAAAPADEASYALGSILEGQPWADAQGLWGAVVLPWLARRGESPAARHALYRGLRIEGEIGQALVLPALSWLARNGLREDASFVLPPLLARRDLEEESARGAVKAALEWLEVNGQAIEGGFVLPPLLARRDLEQGSARGAVKAALEWLGRHLHTPDASFVLQPLLRRADLAAGEQGTRRRYAMAWAEANPHHPELDFVLNPLLRAPITPLEEVHRAAVLAVAWLAKAPPSTDRDYILNSILRRDRVLDDAALRGVVDDALRWIAGTKPAVPVAAGLLRSLEPVARRAGREAEIEALRHACGELPARPSRPATTFHDLTVEIERRAKAAEEPVDLPFLKSALAGTRRKLASGAVAAVGYALQALLPLAARSGSSELLDEARALAGELLWDGVLLSHQRRGFVFACYRLLDAGAWPDPVVGERTLAELGIDRPGAS